MKFFNSVYIVGFVLFMACKPQSKPDTILAPIIMDTHSFAVPAECSIDHLDLDISVDFESHTISGIATYNLKRTKADHIVLDTRDLDIRKVTLDDGTLANFKLEPLDTSRVYMGQSLYIHLKPNTKKISIEYVSSDHAQALQWLSPKQTNGKTLPFLFTQGEATLTRSWIPIQDSPGIRFTYNATVHVPKNMMAVMSASNATEKSPDGIYHFEMKQAIPAYLMALAVGDIAFKSLGDRTGVYAEPSMLDKCVYEFGDIEKILKAAEELYGPYRWERYDILVLPPSFPFGGMENPRLTFATPTIIAGDRSLISLIAHELAHSWSGNLVTNGNWDSFWLNEGFTVYFERRILEKVYGKDFADMEARLGYQDWVDENAAIGANSPDTKLAIDLSNRDPDDGMTDIPYEKGYAFLRYIEENTNRDSFDVFLKKYFDEFAFKSITTNVFLEYLKTNYLSHFNNKINIDEWVFQPGIPKDAKIPFSKKFAAIDEWIDKYKKGEQTEKDLSKDLSAHETVYLIRNLPDSISEKQFQQWTQNYHWSKSNNNEIKAAWLEKAIITGHGKEVLADTENFLLEVGRRKYLEPIYKGLKEHGLEKDALNIYSKARSSYHYVAVRTLDDLLKFKPS